MKKKFYFATLVIALLTFTGCANDEYVGDQQNLGEQNAAIAFSTKSENTVRGQVDGSTAAGKLNNQFWVYGTKQVGSTVHTVFKDYRVEYTGNTSDPYSPKGWEYVGQQVAPAQAQTIKYWDYSASQYDFEAYSIKGTEGTRSVTRDPNAVGEYTVVGINQEGCASLYFAQKKTVSKSNNNYKDAVQLNFKSVLSKIRVGFYETIPGYSVKIDGFYGLNTDGNGWAASENNNNFVAWCPNKKIGDNTSFGVTYVTDNTVDPAVTTPAVTTPTVTKVANIEITSNESYNLDAQLTLGDKIVLQNPISTQSSTVTWDQTNGEYTYFIPQNKLGGGKVQPMKIKVDYTLTSTDDSQEKIKVTGATAIVPAEYLRWKPNTAYSYVFKISDQTNGNTGGSSGPAGLYPITFDAVVEQMEDYRKDYLTTVSDLSITATQDGPFADADKAVFKKDDVIKVKVMRYNGSDPVDITDGLNQKVETDKFYAVFVKENTYKPNMSIEDYFDEANQTTTYDASEKVFTLDSPSDAAGYWIVKVTFKVGNETITKYAVLKVGIETPSTSGNGEGQGA